MAMEKDVGISAPEHIWIRRLDAVQDNMGKYESSTDPNCHAILKALHDTRDCKGKLLLLAVCLS